MTPHFDVIVLGQGLAGAALTWSLRWNGLRVLVIDREAKVTSSKIAAGLITPITGQKLVPTWRYEELWPAAVSFYRRTETDTSARFFSQPGMVRLFVDEYEMATFDRRRANGEFDGFVQHPRSLVDDRWPDAQLGAFEMTGGGQLDVVKYLTSSREYFRQDGGYLPDDVDVSRDIELSADGIRLPRLGVSALRIVFCQGIDAIDNPWFLDVQFKPAKGEILTLRIPGLMEERVVHRGIWLAPLGGELFRVGSTYEWKTLDSQPTLHARDEIIARLKEFLRLPFEVISHQAAIRPIHRNQYPVVGLHPVHPQLAYFSGLGSKGALHAPFFAQHLAKILDEGGAIDPDVDLIRKTKRRSVEPGNSIGGRSRSVLQAGEKVVGEPHGDQDGSRGLASTSSTSSESILANHVERRSSRPLTQQAQDAVREVLRVGQTAIDATAGNGHDTQFLAEQVGSEGVVFAFDIQADALERTAKRLAAANLRNVVSVNQDHGELRDRIPLEQRDRIAVVMFNLGYLPGGDKRVTTRENSTRRGILQAAELLRAGGLLTIVAYKGHDGGAAEADAVVEVLDSLARPEFDVATIESQPGRHAGPRLFLVKRRTASA